MKATIPYIEQQFKKYNTLCFAGKLPPIPIELSNAKSFLGVCVYKRRKTLSGKIKYNDFRLRFSTRIELSERELDDTIIHEMIHYHIALNDIRDTSVHGEVFRRIMNSINDKFDRNVKVSHRCSPEQREQAFDKREHYHVIAVVSFHDGRTGFKVLPRIRERILNYYNNVSKAGGISSVEMYISKDIFFNRYPNSGTFTVHYHDKADLVSHLEKSQKIDIGRL